MTSTQHNPWRSDFPALSIPMNGKPLAYLDSGASAQKPRVVIDAMTDVMEQGYANVHRGLYRLSSDLTTRFEQVRDTVARFIGAPSPDNIIFTRGTTEGINLIAQSWGRAHISAGDEIILTRMEHHANIVPWQMVAAEKGAVIRVVDIDADGQLRLDQLRDYLSPKTKLVAFTHISNVLGTINDITHITALVKSYAPDICVVVDGSQGVVHAPVDVQNINCDFYVFTGHKLYGPTGVGVVYGKRAILDAMPPWQGGGDMIETVSFDHGTTYRTAPHRFEAGTPAIVEVIGLGAALDYIATVGWDRIIAHEKILTTDMMRALRVVPGVSVYGPRENRAGIASFTCDWGHPSDIAMVLDQCGVAVRTGHHCAMPLRDALGIDGTIRASLGLYNDLTDIAALIAGLGKARGMLA